MIEASFYFQIPRSQFSNYSKVSPYSTLPFTVHDCRKLVVFSTMSFMPQIEVMTVTSGLVFNYYSIQIIILAITSLVAQMVKNLPAMQEIWVGNIPWRREWQSTPGFLPGKFHGQRSLAGYSPWGQKEWVTLSLSLIIKSVVLTVIIFVNVLKNFYLFV